MKDIPQKLGRRIKELRKLRKLTQEKLAEQTEISYRFLSRLEVGHKSPSIETLTRLAEALDVELWELFDFGHVADVQELRKTMRKLTQECDKRTLKLVVKVMRAILR